MIERKNFKDVFRARKLRVVFNDDSGDVELVTEDRKVLATISPDDFYDAEGNRFEYADTF